MTKARATGKRRGPEPNTPVFYAVYGGTPTGSSGSFPDLPGAVATGKNQQELERHLSEVLALHLLGEDVVPRASSQATIRKRLEPDEQLVAISPARVNPVSLMVAEVFKHTGKSLRQLAREFGTTHASLSRLQDPFYWGHSLHSLDQLANWLGLEVEVKLKAPSNGPKAA